MNEPKFFVIRCVSTGRLTPGEFRHMTAKYTALSEPGLYCDNLQDYNPNSNQPFWMTFGHDYSQDEIETALKYLKYFTGLYFQDRHIKNYDLDDYIKFKIEPSAA